MEPSLTTARLLVGLIGISLLTGACSSAEETSDGPYAKEIVAAGGEATSDFERSVLSDGEITRAEYEESVQRLVSCAEGRGVKITPIKQGEVYNYSYPLTETSDEVMLECSAGTTLVIETFYSDMVQNPTNGDYEAMVAACLARSGLAPADYDKEQYLADRSAIEKDGVLTPDFPFDGEDPRRIECESDPDSH